MNTKGFSVIPTFNFLKIVTRMSRYGFSQRASSGSSYNRTWALHMISCTVNANGLCFDSVV